MKINISGPTASRFGDAVRSLTFWGSFPPSAYGCALAADAAVLQNSGGAA